MVSDFFYSKSTKLFIARNPLKIDSRIFKAAKNIGLKLSWDDEGRINNLDFNDSGQLLLSLGSMRLSPKEYWLVLEDAKKAKDNRMIDSLCSDQYCEWLDRVYSAEGYFIDHPNLIEKYRYSGLKNRSMDVVGRPGWFNPKNNIVLNLGTPKKVELFRDKFSSHWKYWSPDFSVTQIKFLAPLRGYVTSVGKPSLDLGIPPDSKQPMQMIRECRIKLLSPPVNPTILKQAEDLIGDYESLSTNLNSKAAYDYLYNNKDKYLKFIARHGNLFSKSKENLIYKIREKLYDLVGILKLIFIEKKDNSYKEKLDEAVYNLSGIRCKTFSYGSFSNFIKSSKKRLSKADNEKKDIVFITGHKNPDTDTAVSCLFESWRNSLIDNTREYIPIIQNYKVPDEVRELLGMELSGHIILHEDLTYNRVKNSGLARWISVDQNNQSDIQKYFIAMIDHHVLSNIATMQDIPKTTELVGSCTSLVFQKMLGMNIYPDKQLSRILYGATLMDTENRIKHKMTLKDSLTMDYLKQISEIISDDAFYGDLMSYLLNTLDSKILFGRDYKEDWGFGFAVIKIKGGFDKGGNILKKDLFKKTKKLGEENNLKKNLPLTLLRITDYMGDNITVNRERIYPIFNRSSSREFKEAIFNILYKIIRFEFGNINVRQNKSFIEFWGGGIQLSRKKTAPIIQSIVEAYHEYFYSPANNFWVKRNFLKYSKDTINAAKKHKILLSKDKDGRLNYLTFPEIKKLTNSLGFSMLSLAEYWACLNDAKKIQDFQMVKSLQGSNFVEFTDTIIKNHEFLIEHPVINIKGISSFIFGKEIKVNIPPGSPGLINPQEIDLSTGIPKKVRKPNEYGTPGLWRYWEPDSDLVIPTRSYIFLLKQPCWDGKVHLEDSFPNLGVRPCCKKLKFPEVIINSNATKLIVIIKKEGENFKHIWKK